MIAKKMIANTRAGAAPKDDTAPVVTPPKWRSPKWTYSPTTTVRFTSSHSSTHVTKADYLVTPSTPSVSSSPPWYPHTSLRSGNQHKAFMDIYDNGLVISLLSASAASYPKPYARMESRWWMVVSVLEGGWDHGSSKHALSGGQTYSDYEFVVRGYEKNETRYPDFCRH
jgi:hypothetical protein